MLVLKFYYNCIKVQEKSQGFVYRPPNQLHQDSMESFQTFHKVSFPDDHVIVS